jgi:hypothetical protein
MHSFPPTRVKNATAGLAPAERRSKPERAPAPCRRYRRACPGGTVFGAAQCKTQLRWDINLLDLKAGCDSRIGESRVADVFAMLPKKEKRLSAARIQGG